MKLVQENPVMWKLYTRVPIGPRVGFWSRCLFFMRSLHTDGGFSWMGVCLCFGTAPCRDGAVRALLQRVNMWRQQMGDMFPRRLFISGSSSSGTNLPSGGQMEDVVLVSFARKVCMWRTCVCVCVWTMTDSSLFLICTKPDGEISFPSALMLHS